MVLVIEIDEEEEEDHQLNGILIYRKLLQDRQLFLNGLTLKKSDQFDVDYVLRPETACRCVDLENFVALLTACQKKELLLDYDDVLTTTYEFVQCCQLKPISDAYYYLENLNDQLDFTVVQIDGTIDHRLPFKVYYRYTRPAFKNARNFDSFLFFFLEITIAYRSYSIICIKNCRKVSP